VSALQKAEVEPYVDLGLMLTHCMNILLRASFAITFLNKNFAGIKGV
jgi:hypothetical protein